MAKFATADVTPFQAADPPADPPPIPQPSPADPPPAPVWNPDMTTAPRDGRMVLLTEDIEREDGVRAVWYTARGQARPWAKAPVGWMGVEPRAWVAFEPAGWALP